MDANEWAVGDLFNIAFETIRNNQLLNLTYRITLTLLQLWVSTWAVVWMSIFIYILFYNMYIPSVTTLKDVYIQYDSTCDFKIIGNSCKIPIAKLALTEGRTPELMRGQTYHFSIDLFLPESEVNWSQGMFMVRLTLFDQKRNTALNMAKPTGLKYKSAALRAIFLLLYWPFYVMGFKEETQHISIELITNFVEGSHSGVGPTIEAVIEFEARDVQIYPPTILKITAALSGLRYYMYHWYLTSFVIGTSSLSFFLYIITLIGFTRFYGNFQNDNQMNDNNEDMAENTIEEVNEENKNSVNDEKDEEIIQRVNEQLTDQNVFEGLFDDLNESGLTGDLSANESEASSTVVIPETEDADDSQPVPDSSSAQK